MELLTGGHRPDLDIAGLAQEVRPEEGLGRDPTERVVAMVATDEQIVRSSRRGEAPAERLVLVELVFEVAEHVAEVHRRLVDPQQAALDRPDRGDRFVVTVDEEVDVGSGAEDPPAQVDRAVVGPPPVVVNGRAIGVDGDETRCGRFVPVHAVRMGEVVVVDIRHAGADRTVDEVAHAVQVDGPIHGRELDAGRPLRSRVGRSIGSVERSIGLRQVDVSEVGHSHPFCPIRHPFSVCFIRRNVAYYDHGNEPGGPAQDGAHSRHRVGGRACLLRAAGRGGRARGARRARAGPSNRPLPRHGAAARPHPRSARHGRAPPRRVDQPRCRRRDLDGERAARCRLPSG